MRGGKFLLGNGKVEESLRRASEGRIRKLSIKQPQYQKKTPKLLVWKERKGRRKCIEGGGGTREGRKRKQGQGRACRRQKKEIMVVEKALILFSRKFGTPSEIPEKTLRCFEIISVGGATAVRDGRGYTSCERKGAGLNYGEERR